MKKLTLKIAVILIFFSFVTGCQREEFIDLSGFVNGCKENGANIEIDDFYIEKSDSREKIYYSFPEKDKSRIMIKLLCNESGKIAQIRIFLPKTDENGKVKEITSDDINLFISVAVYSVCSFSGCDEDAAENLLREMSLYEEYAYEKEGELTKEKDKFYYVYLSAYLGSEIIIRNTYLSKPEKTEKPVSKPLYGETVTTRKDTDSLE